MQKINNYKKIRVKPNLYGFTFKSLLSFLALAVVITIGMFFNMELSFTKLIIWFVLLLCNYIINRYVLGESEILEKLGAKKLPDEITDLTK